MIPMNKRRMRGSAVLRTLLVCHVVGLAMLFATGWEGIMHSISMSPWAAGTAPSTSEGGSIGVTSSLSPVGGPRCRSLPSASPTLFGRVSSTNDGDGIGPTPSFHSTLMPNSTPMAGPATSTASTMTTDPILV